MDSNIFRKLVVWSFLHDEMLCREITGTKKSTVARERKEKKRKEVAENLNQIEAVYFTVDKRAVRDRYNLLARELKTKSKKEGKKTGGTRGV